MAKKQKKIKKTKNKNEKGEICCSLSLYVISLPHQRTKPRSLSPSTKTAIFSHSS